jgi:hypothetical protein
MKGTQPIKQIKFLFSLNKNLTLSTHPFFSKYDHFQLIFSLTPLFVLVIFWIQNTVTNKNQLNSLCFIQFRSFVTAR